MDRQLASSGDGAAGCVPDPLEPIAITSDDQFVWSVNPDNNSVSVFNVALNPGQKVAEIPVGIEPWCVAITPNNAKVYVTNMVSGTVSVINATTRAVIKTIPVGTEPFGCALSPDGKKLYVANQSSDDVSLINTATDVVTKTIRPVGPKPHGIAVSADGTKVYVTQFLSQSKADDDLRPLTQTEGADDGRVGRVTVLDGVGDRPIRVVTLKSFDVAAFFQSDGNTLAREPLTGVFNNPTKAFPNLLESILIRGNIAYVTGTCSSPNGPFRFNVNVQSCVSTIDTAQDVEIKTVNMNDGVNFEVPGETRLFNTNPFALAFKRSAAEGFVAVAATNRLLRVIARWPGRPDHQRAHRAAHAGRRQPDHPDPASRSKRSDRRGRSTRSLRRQESTRPRHQLGGHARLRDGFPLARRGRRRHLGRRSDPVQDPAAGCLGGACRGRAPGRDRSARQVPLQRRHRAGRHGRQLPAPRGTDVGLRLGLVLWMPPQRALADSVTWMFADGPRQTISMESTFPFGQAVIQNGAPKLPESHQRALNWSAIRDSVQDFERNIRAVSGGGGLIREGFAEGAAGLVNIPDFLCGAAPSPPCKTPNTGRDSDLDAIATYLALGVRAPISPVKSGVVKKGRALFETAGCANCHGGPTGPTAFDFAPPPAANQIVDAQLIKFLCRVGTFDRALFTDGVSNEIKANNAANVQARGTDGFNPPSLIAVFNSAPYLHSGAAPTLDAVLENVTHRNGRPGGRPGHPDRRARPEGAGQVPPVD